MGILPIPRTHKSIYFKSKRVKSKGVKSKGIKSKTNYNEERSILSRHVVAHRCSLR